MRRFAPRVVALCAAPLLASGCHTYAPPSEVVRVRFAHPRTDQ